MLSQKYFRTVFGSKFNEKLNFLIRFEIELTVFELEPLANFAFFADVGEP